MDNEYLQVEAMHYACLTFMYMGTKGEKKTINL